ncbi:Armadillo-like helical [Quillaja saponaria]|uniref:Armadillo-like helical n=1 Tax=Quillaja saponaria TaxID=32244 RepID=A0AAD7QCN1_QUISA|nr:Armadillo-like helical [Quillaja saponaria]
MEDPSQEDGPRVLKVLEALKQASHELQTHPSHKLHESHSSAIKALLELENESDKILSKDPNLSALSQHLTDLKTLVESLQKSGGHSLRSFLSRRISTYSISRIAGSIESEIQAWIDREIIDNLTRALEDPFRDEDKLVTLLIQFEERVSQGFSRKLQDLVLESKLFSLLESVLCNPNYSKRIREHSAFGIAALIRFNKDVFVGHVLMGATVRVLIAMASTQSIEVLCSLIRSIKSPLVDEIESNGEIPKIISFLNFQDLQMQVLGLDCVLEIGYFGRKEAVDTMLKEGLIKKLVELQISELGGDLIDLGWHTEKENREVSVVGLVGKRESREKRFIDKHPFASCVARFSVQLEVGEGLRQREKRAFKQEIVRRVREASVSDAEAATIVAEVLWGSSP